MTCFGYVSTFVVVDGFLQVENETSALDVGFTVLANWFVSRDDWRFQVIFGQPRFLNDSNVDVTISQPDS